MLAPSCFRHAAKLPARGCLFAARQQQQQRRVCSIFPTAATKTTTPTTATIVRSRRCRGVHNHDKRLFSILSPLLGRRYVARSPRIPKEQVDKGYKILKQPPPEEPEPEKQEGNNRYYEEADFVPPENPIEEARALDAAEEAERKAKKQVWVLIGVFGICTFVAGFNPGKIGTKIGEWFDVDYSHPVLQNVRDKSAEVCVRFFTFVHLDYLVKDSTIFGGSGVKKVEDGWDGDVKVEYVGKKTGLGRDEFTWTLSFFQQVLPVLAHGGIFHFICNSMAANALLPSMIVLLGVRKVFVAGWCMAWFSGWFSILFEKIWNKELRPHAVPAVPLQGGYPVVQDNFKLEDFITSRPYTVEEYYNRYRALNWKMRQPTPDGKQFNSSNPYANLTDSETSELARLKRLLSPNLGSSGILSGMLALHVVLRTPLRLSIPIPGAPSAGPRTFLGMLIVWAAATMIQGTPSDTGHMAHVGGAIAGAVIGLGMQMAGLRMLHKFKYVF